MAKDEGWEEIDPNAKSTEPDGWEEIDPSLVQMAAPKSTTFQDALLGASQGATMGFGDELWARLKTIRAENPNAYRETWKKLQADLEAAKRNSPNAFLGGEIAGGVGSTLATGWIPGLGQANAVKTAALLPRLGQAMGTGMRLGAIQGGITGVGTGGELGAGTIGDAASGAGGGAVAGALFSPAAVALSEVGPATINFLKEKLAKPVLQAAAPIFRVNRQVAREVLADPATYNKPAQDLAQVGDEFVSKMNQFAGARDEASKAARSLLDPVKKVLDIDEASKLIDDSMRDVKATFIEDGVVDSVDNSLIKQLAAQKRQLKAIAGEKGFLSEADVRDVMDTLTPFTKFTREMSAPQELTSKGYNKIYGRLNEKLGESNPTFADAMKPVSKDTGELKKLAKALGLKNADEFDKDLQRFPLEATDTTYTKLGNLRNKEVTTERLDEFSKKFPDTDIAAMAKRVKNDAILEKGGLFTGTMAGFAQGSLPAILTGMSRDLAGSRAWGRLATQTDPAKTMQPGTFESLVTRPAASLFAQPWNPYEPQK